MTPETEYARLLPGAIAPVPVIVPADEWDNIVRQWGVGYCCEWFGHHYGDEFTKQTARILQERTDAAKSTNRSQPDAGAAISDELVGEVTPQPINQGNEE